MDHYPKISTRELLQWLRSERASEAYAISRLGHGDSDLAGVRARIASLKETLATREHLPTKAERKKIRQDAAKYGRRVPRS